jgi:hypothetical protein
MFEQKNALPCAELHFPIDNRHGLAGARQHHADVRRHVVAAFGIVAEVMGILRHEAVEKLLKIATRGGVGIFHDDNAATGVLNKNGDGPISHAALVDLRLNVIRDFVQAFSVGAHFKSLVMHMHSKPCYFSVAIGAKPAFARGYRVGNQGAAVSSPPSSPIGGLETAVP